MSRLHETYSRQLCTWVQNFLERPALEIRDECHWRSYGSYSQRAANTRLLQAVEKGTKLANLFVGAGGASSVFNNYNHLSLIRCHIKV